jgi:HSP20 family protein
MATEITTKPHNIKQPAIFKMSAGDSLIQRAGDLFDTINRRAYELFESRGRQDGHDLEDWFHAESDLLGPMPVEISEADGQLIVRADLPGFREKDIEVRVEPHRLIISANATRSMSNRNERPSIATGGPMRSFAWLVSRTRSIPAR